MKRPLCAVLTGWLIVLYLYYAFVTLPGQRELRRAFSAFEGAGVLLLGGTVEKISGLPGEEKVLLRDIRLLELPRTRRYMSGKAAGQEKQAVSHITNADVTIREWNKKFPRSGRVLVYPKAGAGCSDGDILIVRGDISFSVPSSNPGQFDAQLYDSAGNILFRMYEAEIQDRMRLGGIRSALHRLRAALRERYAVFLEEEDFFVLSEMTLGERSTAGGQIRRLFQDGGIGHILAISGLHVNLLGMLLYRALRARRCSFFTSGAVSSLALILYCMMTGTSASSLRAVILFLFWAGGQVFGRKTDLPVSLMAAAAFVLTLAPAQITQAGFWLSFGCVISLEALTIPMQRLLPRPLQGIRGLAQSIAVTLGTLPLCCWFFYQITPYSILINLAVIPCLSILIFFLAAGSLLSMVSVSGAIWVSAPCHYLLLFFRRLCRLETALPGGIWITGRPALWQVICYYLILYLGVYLCLCYAHRPVRNISVRPGDRGIENRGMGSADRESIGRRNTDIGNTGRGNTGRGNTGRGNTGIRQKMLQIIFGLFLLSALTALLWRPSPRLRITFLDVGQGDGILIECGGRAFLSDCGSSSVEKVWEQRVLSCIKYYGIRRLDGIFLSHGDMDHISGVRQAIEGYEKNLFGAGRGGLTIGSVWMSKHGQKADEALQEMKRLAQRKGIPVRYMNAGDHLDIENQGKGLRLLCLYPGEDDLSENTNENSLTLLLDVREVQILLTGDLEKEGEHRMLRQLREIIGRAAGYRILKAGHHGSRHATSRDLLKIFRPDAAVISCGKHNPYGHPAETVLNRLNLAGTKVFRTDAEGCVILRIGPGGMEIKHKHSGG